MNSESETENKPQKGDSVFVYGTLRPGCHAFRLFEGKGELLGQTTLGGAAIFSLGGFPGLKFEDGSTVIGNLVRVDDESLFARLDQYEGYPHLYDRRKVETTDGPAWVYVFNGKVREEHRIVSGDWLNQEYKSGR